MNHSFRTPPQCFCSNLSLDKNGHYLQFAVGRAVLPQIMIKQNDMAKSFFQNTSKYNVLNDHLPKRYVDRIAKLFRMVTENCFVQNYQMAKKIGTFLMDNQFTPSCLLG